MLVFCALFVFYFKYYVGVLRTYCFLLSPLRWCFVHYLFSTFTNALPLRTIFLLYYYVGVLRTICFLLLLLRWRFAHYLFSLTIMLVFCALLVFYYNYYVGVLRTICFLLSLLRWCFAQ